MTELDGSAGPRCASCGRVVLVDGPVWRIEAGRDCGGVENVARWMEEASDPTALSRSQRRRRRDEVADVLVRLRDIAYKDMTRYPEAFNILSPDRRSELVVRIPDGRRYARMRLSQVVKDGELWEVKAGRIRLPCFRVDTCGQQTLRMTHVFEKATPATPRREIDRGLAIMRCDMED
ncbi:hypothetical protein [Actinomyces urogenitalis]|uniref:hypothetical protein n=1 Tax=Actinomyces urogenitalis TaxID=103621 RepID=UPI003C6C32D0